jgi:DNA adenine methylase
VGGKMALRDEILRRFPLSYQLYVEVFGGAGWVLFHKPPDTDEVYNDFNTNLVTLYRMVKSSPEALIHELDWSLNSRDGFSELKALFTSRTPMADIQRAACFFKLIKYSYGSKCVSFGCLPTDLERYYPAIRGAHRRLRGVVIENKDFEALISLYDKRDGAFFYLDPPYYGTEDYYMDVGFTQADHIRLKNALEGIQGKFLLSYNDDPFIRELYAGYRIESVTRLNNLAQRHDPGAEYPELFIANYDMSERGRQNEQLSLLAQ